MREEEKEALKELIQERVEEKREKEKEKRESEKVWKELRRRWKNPELSYKCSFCGEHVDNVKRLIMGYNRIGICEVCVIRAYQIIQEEKG